MKGLIPGIEYLKNGINGAKDTRQAIITAANSYEYIQKKIKEIEKKAWEEIKNEKVETIHFDPNEIEPIVLKDRGNKIVSQDKFKEKLRVKQEKQLEAEGKIIPTQSRENKEERDIG